MSAKRRYNCVVAEAEERRQQAAERTRVKSRGPEGENAGEPKAAVGRRVKEANTKLRASKRRSNIKNKKDKEKRQQTSSKGGEKRPEGQATSEQQQGQGQEEQPGTKTAKKEEGKKLPQRQFETRIRQRRRQISLGKETAEYKAYIDLIPKKQRGPEHPRTPDPYRGVSKRAFDGLVRQWRRALHAIHDPQSLRKPVARRSAAATAAKPVKKCKTTGQAASLSSSRVEGSHTPTPTQLRSSGFVPTHVPGMMRMREPKGQTTAHNGRNPAKSFTLLLGGAN